MNKIFPGEIFNKYFVILERTLGVFINFGNIFIALCQELFLIFLMQLQPNFKWSKESYSGGSFLINYNLNY